MVLKSWNFKIIEKMKNILLFLIVCLLSTQSISQTSSWRTNQPQSSSSTQSRSVDVPSTTSSWRNTSPREFNKPKSNNTVIVRDPWFDFGWNRWGMWGAPSFGWNSYHPTWYYNDWGYRQPARVYYYNDGRKDTVKGKKPIVSFGFHHTTNRQMGTFFTIGNKGYFVFDFNTTYERDHSTYFPYGTINLVDFPLISDLVKQNSFHAGLGKRIGRIGVHGMVGIANERILWRGKDDVGEITFPKSKDNFLTFKFGIMKDFKNFTTKIDYDPIVNYGQLGLGLNF
jgi:hypothetical protein